MVKDGMFLGQFSHNLDDKNRVIIPARMREQMNGTQLFISKGIDQCLEIRELANFNIWIKQLSALGIGHQQARILSRNVMATSEQIKVDSLGRIKISNPLLNIIGLNANDKALMIIGNNQKIEIWTNRNWEKYITDTKGWEELISNFSEKI